MLFLKIPVACMVLARLSSDSELNGLAFKKKAMSELSVPKLTYLCADNTLLTLLTNKNVALESILGIIVFTSSIPGVLESFLVISLE